MFSRVRAWLARRRTAATPPTITATADGFRLGQPAAEPVEVRWAAVRRAAAYKRDLYTTDAIMLLFELDPPGPGLLELSDEWPGFADLFGGMERALGVSPAWYVEIMTPVFEATPRVLFERPAPAP